MSSAGPRFFVLDGIDGCGKTTQAKRLVRALSELGRGQALHLREPGSTALGEGLRAMLLSHELELGAEVETLLFAAARRQMLDSEVRPALEDGRDVVCERFHPATFAYQAVAGGLDEERVLSLLRDWAGEPRPDRVLWLNLPVDTAHERASTRAEADRIEAKGKSFQRAVAAGFERYAELEADLVSEVDASGTTDEVFERLMHEVRRAL